MSMVLCHVSGVYCGSYLLLTILTFTSRNYSMHPVVKIELEIFCVRYISTDERLLILDSQQQQQQHSATTSNSASVLPGADISNATFPAGEDSVKTLKVPWRKIFSSVPFLSLTFAHFCNNFGW